MDQGLVLVWSLDTMIVRVGNCVIVKYKTISNEVYMYN